MTLFQIIDRFQKLALSAPNVRTASNGDVYAALNDNPQVKYGVFFITQNTHQELEDMDRYGLTFFYIDRLDDTLEDNRLQIQSIGKEVISTVIRDFCEEYDVDVPTINYTPFQQKFKDLTAGVYAQLTLEVLKGICADDFSEILSVYQTKTVDITENGQFTVTPDSNYDALEKVIINVDVPCSGSSYEEGFADGYDSGYTDGYQDGLADCGSDYDAGFEDGVAEQKSKLVATAFTENGTYTREDGFNIVTVSVSQTGYTQEDLDDAYNRGYLDGLNDCSGSGDTKEYLTFEITSPGNIVWKANSTDYTVTLEYKKNDGEWTEITSTTAGVEIPVVSGDTIQFRGNNTRTRNSRFGDSTANYKVKGNIMSLLSKENFETLNTLQNFDEQTFANLFSSDYYNTGLTDASKLILPATTLASGCYSMMFRSCTSLTAAPALPATILASNCYASMFQGCTSLTSAPALPATTLVKSCYISMFQGCTSLTSAPLLPATTLAEHCYDEMFAVCSSLTNAPLLPATTLADSCYQYMFRRCTSLTSAPELPATTLANYCYANMFSGCTSLNYIKCLAIDISATNSTYNWVWNVASTGTFVKNPAMISWTEGENGIPSGWTIIDA